MKNDNTTVFRPFRFRPSFTLLQPSPTMAQVPAMREDSVVPVPDDTDLEVSSSGDTDAGAAAELREEGAFCPNCWRTFEQVWSECVRIARQEGAFHHKTQAKILNGQPNRLYKAAKKIWRRLPVRLIAKKEEQRLERLRTRERRRMRKTRQLKREEDEHRTQLALIASGERPMKEED